MSFQVAFVILATTPVVSVERDQHSASDYVVTVKYNCKKKTLNRPKQEPTCIARQTDPQVGFVRLVFRTY